MNEQEVKTKSVVTTDAGALSLVDRAEIDMQIATAKQFPRSIATFKKRLLELATIDQEVAQGMFYTLSRKTKEGKKKIDGPTIRFAEIVCGTYQNLRYKGRVVEILEKEVVCEGQAIDLENNIAASVEVRRGITYKDGGRYSDEMIKTTANAGIAIAIRNAVFKVVPFQLAKEAYQAAREASTGKGLTLEQKREKMFTSFKDRFKLTEDDILNIAGKQGKEDLTIDDIIDLRGVFTALVDGETTVKELLNQETPKSTIQQRLEQTEAERHQKDKKVPETGGNDTKTDTQDDVSEKVDTETGELFAQKHPDSENPDVKSDEEMTDEEKEAQIRKGLHAQIVEYSVQFTAANRKKDYVQIFKDREIDWKKAVTIQSIDELQSIIDELQAAFKKGE